MLTELRFLNGGFCWQSVYLSGVPSFRFRKFQAVFLAFKHRKHGHCLIDTGYGPHVFEATRRFPYRLLRWFTPIPRGQEMNQPGFLDRIGIEATAVDTVFLSHFHADHIGGTRLFPNARFVYRAASYEELKGLVPQEQIDRGFVPGLLPDDFAVRGEPIDEGQFNEGIATVQPFRGFDYWGDGSLYLIDLPGHADGHTGYWLNTDHGPVLYVVDSFWDQRAFESGRRLSWIARRFQRSYSDYVATQMGLKELVKREGVVPLACHCPQTQDYV